MFNASVSQNFVLEYEKRMQTIHDKSEKLKHRFAQLLVSGVKRVQTHKGR